MSLINTAIKSGVPSIADLLLRRKRVWINKALLSAIYARKKEKITLEAKVVKIYNIDFISFDGENAVIKINCSSGTYVRSVVNIIGKILGCGATLTSLLRTRIGSYDISESVTLDELERNAYDENFFKLFGKGIESMDGFSGKI